MLTLSMPTRIEQLTGLRFVAAFVVLVSHFHSLASTSGLFFFSMLGNHGVTLFFVLSGFVLTHRYGGERITRISAHGSIYPALDWRKYAFARFARVAPAYWLSLLVAALAYAISGHEISLREPPSNTTQAILSFAVNWLAL